MVGALGDPDNARMLKIIALPPYMKNATIILIIIN